MCTYVQRVFIYLLPYVSTSSEFSNGNVLLVTVRMLCDCCIERKKEKTPRYIKLGQVDESANLLSYNKAYGNSNLLISYLLPFCSGRVNLFCWLQINDWMHEIFHLLLADLL